MHLSPSYRIFSIVHAKENLTTMADYNQVLDSQPDYILSQVRFFFFIANESTASTRCICGSKFTRPDALKRHIKSKNKVAQYPCLLCDRHQGPKAFTRADHLTQHLRGVHKQGRDDRAETEPQQQASVLFPVPVPVSQDQAPAPAVEAQMANLPMPPFLCLVPHCDRWGWNGFFQQRDLDEHMMLHAVLPGYMSNHPGPAYPDNPLMNDGFDHGQDLQQSMFYPPAESPHENGVFHANEVGEHRSGFQLDDDIAISRDL
ncbi:hypothetical protein F5Y19DRAFT_449127, partial [Xylariaceae sp. FL1651]